jgi:two-component system heavy metal sensor histidine kinase CusS
VRIKNSIVNRIGFWFFVSTSVLAFASIFIFYVSVKQNFAKESLNVVSERMQTLRAIMQRKEDDPLPAVKHRIESDWANISFERIYIRLRNLDGSVISVSPNAPSEVINEIFPPVTSVDSSETRKTTKDGSIYLTASELFNFRQKQSQVYADLAFDLTPEQNVLSELRKKLFLIVALVLFGSMIFGRRLAFASLRPVQNIVKRASAIRSSNLHERIETSNLPSELELLAETFNKMLDRLSDSFNRMSQFSSDIAHELRTPINNIRGEIEVSFAKDRTPAEYREVLSSCLEELERIAKITDSLLFIAKAEDPATQLDRETFDLKAELEKIVDFYETSAHEAGVQVKVRSDRDLFLPANRIMFQRAVGNLISNALAHTPQGGVITVTGSENAEWTKIEVADTGNGIAPEHLSKIFDRFYRADPSRSGRGAVGFGLGLAIVRGIISMHGGQIDAQSSQGSGTQITLKFPKRA